MNLNFSSALSALAAVLVGMTAVQSPDVQAQDNPYRLEPGWAKYPAGRKWGSTSGVDVDRDGNIWAFERCGERSCADSKLDTVFRFDRAGNVMNSFGGDMFIFPHGMAPGYWVPEKEGALPESLPHNWKPLEPFKKYTTIMSGLHSRSAEPPPGATGADHWVASAFMCAVKPKKTAGADVACGTTIDQLIAQKIGRDNLMPSMQLAVEDPGANSSNCGEGYSCTYTNTISWSSPTQPLPMELNPQVVFERMFGDGSTAELRNSRRKRDGSILDSLTGSLGRLKLQASSSDKARLDDFSDNVREIERRLQIAMKASTVAPTEMAVPVGVPQTFDEHIKLQFDLMALAFQADITRVGTLLFARDLTNRTYPECEAPGVSFHGASHHGEDPRRIAELSKINQYHVKTLAYFVDKLANTPDGNGSLLDHSLLMYGSNMGNPNQHAHYDVPHILIGGAGGKLKGGRHLNFATKTITTGSVLQSILAMFDIPVETLGDSTGLLPGLA